MLVLDIIIRCTGFTGELVNLMIYDICIRI